MLPCFAIQANLQKYLEKQQSIKAPESSDESSGDEDAVDAEDERVKEILEKVFQSYSLDGANRQRTGEAIRAAMKRGLNSCLICIGSIRKNDPIWNCEHCCCSFHINCIQRWGKDSVFQQKQVHSSPISIWITLFTKQFIFSGIGEQRRGWKEVLLHSVGVPQLPPDLPPGGHPDALHLLLQQSGRPAV